MSSVDDKPSYGVFTEKKTIRITSVRPFGSEIIRLIRGKNVRFIFWTVGLFRTDPAVSPATEYFDGDGTGIKTSDSAGTGYCHYRRVRNRQYIIIIYIVVITRCPFSRGRTRPRPTVVVTAVMPCRVKLKRFSSLAADDAKKVFKGSRALRSAPSCFPPVFLFHAARARFRNPGPSRHCRVLSPPNSLLSFVQSVSIPSALPAQRKRFGPTSAAIPVHVISTAGSTVRYDTRADTAAADVPVREGVRPKSRGQHNRPVRSSNTTLHPSSTFRARADTPFDAVWRVRLGSIPADVGPVEAVRRAIAVERVRRCRAHATRNSPTQAGWPVRICPRQTKTNGNQYRPDEDKRDDQNENYLDERYAS